MTITKTAFKKIFGVLAVLFGVFMLLIALNDIFYFTVLIEPEPARARLTVGRVLFCLIMITVGMKWLIDPID